MEEAFVYGVAVAVVMLGMPLWRSVGGCRKGRIVELPLWRWWLLCALMIFISLVFSLLIEVAKLPTPGPPLLSTHCKIVSRGLDIRSTKVCETGSLPDDPNVVRNPNSIPKFDCHLDYYWTSVLKVEFTPRASKSAVQAGAVSPKEPLPLKCRPSFGAAWRTKEAYQINSTYPCKYSPLNLKMVDIAEHTTADCRVQQPSKLQMLKDLWILLVNSYNAIFSGSSQTTSLFSTTAASTVLGSFYSIIVVYVTKTLSHGYFYFYQGKNSDLDVVYITAWLQLIILFTASLSILILLSSYYMEEATSALQIVSFYNELNV